MQGKVLLNRSAMNEVYVGIDVCKDRLDVYLHPLGQHLRVVNSRQGLGLLKRRLAKVRVLRIVMEATGKHHRQAHRTLHGAGFAVCVINPLRARLFAEARGTLAKTDAIDARVLALLGEGLAPEARPPAPEDLEALQELVHARAAATAEATALANRSQASHTAFLKLELKRRIKALEGHIARIEAEIGRRIAAEPALARRYAILLSIPGIGPVVAMTLIVDLAELGQCSRRALALLAGLAPIACESGDTSGQRHIKGGRAVVRRTLYMAAVAAARCNPDLAAFYKRLRDAGKKAKVALTAVMRKLIVLANTLIKEDRPWQELRP